VKRQVWLGAVLVVVLLAGLGAWGLLGAVEPERALKYTLYSGSSGYGDRPEVCGRVYHDQSQGSLHR
jgi:hypothetical protein